MTYDSPSAQILKRGIAKMKARQVREAMQLDAPFADRFLREQPESLDELGVDLPEEKAPE